MNNVFTLQERQYVTMGDFLRNGYILALLMFMVTMVQNSLLQTHYHLVIREGIRLRAALQVNVCHLSLLPDLRARNAVADPGGGPGGHAPPGPVKISHNKNAFQ